MCIYIYIYIYVNIYAHLPSGAACGAEGDGAAFAPLAVHVLLSASGGEWFFIVKEILFQNFLAMKFTRQQKNHYL